jgi:hypothetical protein
MLMVDLAYFIVQDFIQNTKHVKLFVERGKVQCMLYELQHNWLRMQCLIIQIPDEML